MKKGNGIAATKEAIENKKKEIAIMELCLEISGECPDSVILSKDKDLVVFRDITLQKVRKILSKLKDHKLQMFTLKFAGSEDIVTESPFALSVSSYKHCSHKFDSKLQFTVILKNKKLMEFWFDVVEDFSKLPTTKVGKGDRIQKKDKSGSYYTAYEYEGTFPDYPSPQVCTMNYAGASITYYCKNKTDRKIFEEYVLNAKDFSK